MRPVIAVACGVLQKANGDVLIAQRPSGKIAAGKWEFPGGKIEAGESALQALKRELHEELGITVITARPLLAVTHDYSDRRVLLDTWLISAWQDEPQAHEGQGLAWCQSQHLQNYDLLAADAPIVAALCLPQHYVFTPPNFRAEEILAGLHELPKSALLRLRLPDVSEAEYLQTAQRVLPVARAQGLRVILDRGGAVHLQPDGWHLTASALRSKPCRLEGLLFASCHSADEVRLARELGADAVVLGPVLAKPGEPERPALGWENFRNLQQASSLPAYAIGGVKPSHLGVAQAHYAQGVAGISAYWSAATTARSTAS